MSANADHEPSRFAGYVDAVYRAIWADARDMNAPAAVAGVLQRAGFEPAAMMALAADPAVKERLKAVTQSAVERGVFGAPTFFLDGQMYWGQDRLDFIQHALESPAP